MDLLIYSETPSIVWISDKYITDQRIDSSFYNAGQISNQQKLLESELDIKKLDEIITKMNSPIGWEGIPSTAYLPKGNGIPLLRVSNIVNNEIDFDNVIDVIPTIYDSQPSIQATADDVIITRVGTIGRVCKVPSNVGKLAMGQNLTKVTIKKKLVDPNYLLIYMNTDYCINQMIRYAYGGVQSSLTNKNIRELLVPIPKKRIQYYIGDKVGKAEELREEARRLKKEAEEAFYTCINLEPPVKTTSRGKLFTIVKPNDIGRIWGAEAYKEEYIRNQQVVKGAGEYVYLSQCYKLIVNGIDNRSYTSFKGGTPYYKVATISLWGIRQDAVDYIDMSLADVPKKQEIACGDLLITRKGTFGIAMGVNENYTSGVISSEIFRLKLLPEWDADYLAYFLNSEYGRKQFFQYATGSTMKGISQENITEILVPKVSIEIQIQIGELVRTIKDKLFQANILISEAKQDVEDLIEGRFDESRISGGEKNEY